MCYFLKETTKGNLTQKVLFLIRNNKERHENTYENCRSLEGTTTVPCREQQIKYICKLLFLRGNNNKKIHTNIVVLQRGQQLFLRGKNSCSLKGTTKKKQKKKLLYNLYKQIQSKQKENFYVQISKTNELFTGLMLRMGCLLHPKSIWWNIPVIVGKRTPW